MPVYAYQAIDAQSRPVRGTVAAETPAHARQQLRTSGISIEKIRVQRNLPRLGWFPVLHRSQAQAPELLRELSTLLAVGLPLSQSLQTLIDQRHRRVKAALMRMRQRVDSGGTLADAMESERALFNEFVIAMARVGEQSGGLQESLTHAATFLAKAESFKSRLIAPLIYPAAVVMVGMAVAVFLMTYVIPQILDNLPNPDQSLPLVTRIIKSVSDCLVGYWWLWIVVVILSSLIVVSAAQINAVREYVDQTLLRLPMVRTLILRQEMARLCVSLAALTRSGVQLVEALTICQAVLGNRTVRRAVRDVGGAILAGRGIDEAAASTRVLPQTLVNVFALGQQSGRLEELLEQVGALYDEQSTTFATRLIAVLEPILIIGLVLFVGTIAFATILPILQAGEGL